MPQSGSRHALIIGINAYPNAGVDPLEGCVNDAKAIRDLLQRRYGFDQRDVELLTDAAATQRGIEHGFERLIDAVGQDDQVFVFYAGHGSRMPRDDGRWVETLVPHDSGRGDAPNRDVLDVEIDAWVRRLNQKTPWVTLVFDCCHSGSVTRDLDAPTTREAPAETRSLESMGRSLPERPAGHTGQLVPGVRSAVVLAACRADQKAHELRAVDGLKHGAFTWHLLRVLDAAQGSATWRDVLRRIAPPLTARYPSQMPGAEGAVDRAVFGRGVTSRAPFAVTARADAERVWISAGAAHGVTMGTDWTLTPALADGQPEEGTVDAVEALRARVRGARQAEVGWGAQVKGQPETRSAQPVRVLAPGDQGAADRLRAIIAKTDSLRPAAPDEDQAVTVHWVPAGAAPFNALPAEQTDSWVAVGPDGRIAVEVAAAGQEGPLIEGLEGLARFQALLGLDFPDQSPTLQAGVRLAVHRCDAGDASAPVPPHADDGLPRLTPGDQVDFVITNTTGEALYATLVEFAPDRSIQLVMPYTQLGETAAAGQLLDAGGAPLNVMRDYLPPILNKPMSNGVKIKLPSGFPWNIDTLQPSRGAMTLRLLVTRTPQDFSFMAQPRVRDLRGDDIPLTRRLLRAARGEPHRSVLDLPSGPVARADAGYAVIDVSMTIAAAGGREISPSTGGRVLFYKIADQRQTLGEVGITAVKMSTLPTMTSYWSWWPTGAWPDTFTLTPGDDVPEGEARSRLKDAWAMTNPKFGTAKSPLEAPSKVDQSWAVEAGGRIVAWMARVGGALHWYTAEAEEWLPKAQLVFRSAPLPVGKQTFSAIDVAAHKRRQ